MDDAAPPRDHTSSHPDCLVLLQEDLSSRLDHLLRELIRDGHHLQIESQNGQGPASFLVEGGLRLYGDAGIFNTRTVRAVLERSIEGADDDFQLDLDGLDYLALMTWAAVLQVTQDFRTHGGVLRVHARRRTRRLLAMSTALASDRTNLEITSQATRRAPVRWTALSDGELPAQLVARAGHGVRDLRRDVRP